MNSAVHSNDPVFGDTLICQEVRPYHFEPANGGLFEPFVLRDAVGQAASIMATLALVETHDEGDEAADPNLMRIERKVDLLISMVASVVRQNKAGDRHHSIEWSASGAIVESDVAYPAATLGFLHVQPSPMLPADISLPCEVVGTLQEGGKTLLRLAFRELSPSLSTELEGHLFRIDRRAVADSRRHSDP